MLKARMPRIPRGQAAGYVYHIINRGNGRSEIFHKSQDYQAFLDLLSAAKKRQPVKVLAFCLMPNHFHLVLGGRKRGTGYFFH
jgi:putative transposase